MPRDDRAGFDTWWTTFGQGPREALMIHCSLAHSGSWGGLARHLSGALTMTAFDMPGHGRSADWDDRGEIQGETAQIAAAFCESGPRDVIGHSFGATVALRLAVERPELVRSLVLIEPVFFAVALTDHPGLRPVHEAQFAGYAQAMEAGDMLNAAREFTTIWGDGTPWEAIPPEQQQVLADQMYLIAAGSVALHDDPGGMLRPGVLQGLERPVLLIEGDRSPSIIGRINEGLAARLPLARRVVVAGAAHMVPITHARAVGQEVLQFLQDGAP